jgi:PBP1b-binding outer membrane lipoprotein LpoB
MIKSAALVVVIFLAFVLAGCGNERNYDSNPNISVQQQTPQSTNSSQQLNDIEALAMYLRINDNAIEFRMPAASNPIKVFKASDELTNKIKGYPSGTVLKLFYKEEQGQSVIERISETLYSSQNAAFNKIVADNSALFLVKGVEKPFDIDSKVKEQLQKANQWSEWILIYEKSATPSSNDKIVDLIVNQ